MRPLVLFAVLALSAPPVVLAGGVDNMGFPVPTPADTSTAGRAFSMLHPAGAGIGALVEPGPVLTYRPLPFDIEFLAGAQGISNDTGADDNALAGVSVMYLPARWVKLGLQAEYKDFTQGLIDYSVPVQFYVFQDPNSSILKAFRLNPIHYTVDSGGDPLSGHWSLQLDPAGVVEVPMGDIALKFKVGVKYLFTSLNDPVNDYGGIDAAAGFIWRLRVVQ